MVVLQFDRQIRHPAVAGTLANGDDDRPTIGSTASGALALWLMIGGLILVGLAALLM